MVATENIMTFKVLKRTNSTLILSMNWFCSGSPPPETWRSFSIPTCNGTAIGAREHTTTIRTAVPDSPANQQPCQKPR